MKNREPGERLYISAFREIRSYIILNGLKEGDLLPTEKTLCERLGVSRNVLREAIKSMELMGMVRACPGRGTEICRFSMDFVFQNVLFFHVGDDDPSVREMFTIQLEQKRPHLSDSVVKHEKIVEALKKGDPAAFEEAMLRHFSSGKYLEKSGYAEY